MNSALELTMPRILIPDSVTWELPELPLEVVRFKRSESLDGLDAEGLVVWGITSKGLAPLLEMPSLKDCFHGLEKFPKKRVFH